MKFNMFVFLFELMYEELFDEMVEFCEKCDLVVFEYFLGGVVYDFKFLVYVLVNDCKYVIEVCEEICGKYDFGIGEYFDVKIFILYCCFLF